MADENSIIETRTRSDCENAIWDLKGGQYATAATPPSLPQPPTTYVLFLADIDSSTGESWCSDCREAIPVLDAAWKQVLSKHAEEVLDPAGQAPPRPVLVKAWVGDRDRWRHENNPFKAWPFAAACVPTLLKWDYGDLSKGINLGKAVAWRLGDKEAKDKEAVAKFFGLS